MLFARTSARTLAVLGIALGLPAAAGAVVAQAALNVEHAATAALENGAGSDGIISPGDTIRVAEAEGSKALVKNAVQMSRGIRQVPSWLAASDEELKGDVVSLPKRADVPFDINELFVVEVCSR